MNTPVSKAIAQRLKNVGFNAPCNDFYTSYQEERYICSKENILDWNSVTEFEGISAPTISEVIEWMDSKGVYVHVTPANKNAFLYEVWNDHNIETFLDGFAESRPAAYLAGVEPALTFLESKMKESEG